MARGGGSRGAVAAFRSAAWRGDTARFAGTCLSREGAPLPAGDRPFERSRTGGGHCGSGDLRAPASATQPPVGTTPAIKNEAPSWELSKTGSSRDQLVTLVGHQSQRSILAHQILVL